MLPNPNPPLAYRFAVDIDDVTAAVFTECTLPSYEIDVKSDINEGGRTGFGIRIPGPFKPGNLSLKRGIVLADNMLDWYFSILNWSFSKGKLYKTVVVTMYKGYLPAFTFGFQNAFPVKWVGPSLRSDTTAVAVEQIDFAYESVTIDKNKVSEALDIAAALKGTLGNVANAAAAVTNLF